MRNKFNIFIIFVFLISCDKGKKIYSNYELVNNTNHEVILNSYDTQNKSLKKTTHLLNKGDNWKSERFQTSEPGGQLLEPNHFFEGDSIRVIFNSNKVLIHIGKYTSNNILYEENYELVVIDEHHTVRKYSFSEDDYENADEL